jgi:OOP family OmpA-OmpF porin
MIKNVFASFLALPLLAAASAHAANGTTGTHQFYLGAATGPSKASLENGAGQRFDSKNHPLPVKLYGGVALTDYLALEAGYSGWTGKHVFDKALHGTTTEPRLSSRALYLAAKGSVAVSERIDLHAKLGVAHSRFELSHAGFHDRDLSSTEPMVGIGAAYKLTESVAATLEFEHYGTVRKQQTKLSQRRLHAGIRFGF